jgi:hypothetical protein
MKLCLLPEIRTFKIEGAYDPSTADPFEASANLSSVFTAQRPVRSETKANPALKP